MINNTFMAFLFCLASSIANAQDSNFRTQKTINIVTGTAYQANKPVMCDSMENITRTMKEQYGEEPVWFGEDIEQNGNFVMLSNFQTKTWTFVQFTRDWACVLGVGTGASQLKVGMPV